MAKKQGMNNGLVAGGIGLAAASVAAVAGGYLLYGVKDAAKNRKKVRGWALKAKGEILEKIENMQEVTEDKYQNVVDAVNKKYSSLKNVDPMELTALISDAKKHWKTIHGAIAGSKKSTKRSPKKKIAKKTTK